MKVSPTKLDGVWMIEPNVFQDSRGFFMETHQQTRYAASGIPAVFVQDNLSKSTRGVLRGLHFQNPNPQGKLVSVLEGCVFDVAVDLRRDSPTFGQWAGFEISSENHLQLYISPGFAHGFVTLSDTALLHYKCTANYDANSDMTLLWDDPKVGVNWPITDPILSPKDLQGKSLDQCPSF